MKIWKGLTSMKKNPKHLVAIAALAAIALLIIAFVISAFTAGPGEAGNRFMALLFCIVAVPILAWLLMFCIEKMQNKNTVTEHFFEQDEDSEKEAVTKEDE